MLDSKGQAFWDAETDSACFETLKSRLRADIPVEEIDSNINDPAFADRAAALLGEMLGRQDGPRRSATLMQTGEPHATHPTAGR